MPYDAEFNKYLAYKYRNVTNLKKLCGKKWRVTDDSTDDPNQVERVWCLEILGKRGAIYPYGFNGTLAVRTETTHARKILDAMGIIIKMVQRGDYERVDVFDPKHVDAVAKIIGGRKVRHLSDKQRIACIERLTKARADSTISKPHVDIKKPA